MVLRLGIVEEDIFYVAHVNDRWCDVFFGSRYISVRRSRIWELLPVVMGLRRTNRLAADLDQTKRVNFTNSDALRMNDSSSRAQCRNQPHTYLGCRSVKQKDTKWYDKWFA